MKPVRLSLFNVLLIAAVMAGLGLITTSAGADAPPTQLSYQGLVKVAGAPFSGTGYFKFAVVDAATGDGASYWLTGPETLTVTNGLFDFMLGSTTPLPSSVFDNDPIYLRVWFSQAAIGPFQPLEPNQRIGSAAYALRAEHALTAGDAAKLGGVAASAYLTTVAGDARYPSKSQVTAIESDVAALDASKLNVSGGTLTGMLTVNAPLAAGDYVKIGASSTTCASGTAGAVRWNGGSLELCNGTTWQTLSTSGGATYALTISRTGNGTVTSSPLGIYCGSACSAMFGSGSTVTLTAMPDAGWTFAGWTGACAGAASCTVTMSAARSVGATFTRNTYALTITKSGAGSGTVTSNPTGISCGATCSYSFDADTLVMLTATPDATSTFTGWGGACSGASTCVVTMTAAKSVTATFDKQTAFKVVNLSQTLSASPTYVALSFGHEVIDDGNTFSGGVYTVPISGLYQLQCSAAMYFQDPNPGHVTIVIYQNGNAASIPPSMETAPGTAYNAQYMRLASTIVRAAAGDTFDCRVAKFSGSSYTVTASFSGYRVY